MRLSFIVRLLALLSIGGCAAQSTHPISEEQIVQEQIGRVLLLQDAAIIENKSFAGDYIVTEIRRSYCETLYDLGDARQADFFFAMLSYADLGGHPSSQLDEMIVRGPFDAAMAQIDAFLENRKMYNEWPNYRRIELIRKQLLARREISEPITTRGAKDVCDIS